MIKYIAKQNVKRICICLALIFLTSYISKNVMNIQTYHFFNGVLQYDFFENMVLIFIQTTMWFIPYFYLYMLYFNDISKYFVECEFYYLIRTKSVSKLVYFVFTKLMLEVFLINVLAFILISLMQIDLTVMNIISNISRMGIFISLMMFVGLFKRNISQFTLTFFSSVFIGSILANLFLEPNIVSYIFLNGSVNILSIGLGIVIIVLLHFLIIFSYKRKDI